EIDHHGVYRDSPGGDRDPRLSRRDEDRCQAAPPRLEVELDRDGLLADRAVGADGQDDLRFELEVLSRRDVEVGGGLAQIAELDVEPGRERRELRIVRDELVQPALDIELALDAALQEISPGCGKAPALGRDADDRDGRVEASRLVDRGDDGDPLVRLARSSGVEDRDDRIRAVADDPAERLPVVGVVRIPLGEDQDALLRAHAMDTDTPRPGSADGTWTPSTSSTPGHGPSRRSRFPSRSTWSQSGATQQPAAIPRPD